MVEIEKSSFDINQKMWIQKEELEHLKHLIRIKKASDVVSWLEGNMNTFTFEVQMRIYYDKEGWLRVKK